MFYNKLRYNLNFEQGISEFPFRLYCKLTKYKTDEFSYP